MLNAEVRSSSDADDRVAQERMSITTTRSRDANLHNRVATLTVYDESETLSEPIRELLSKDKERVSFVGVQCLSRDEAASITPSGFHPREQAIFKIRCTPGHQAMPVFEDALNKTHASLCALLSAFESALQVYQSQQTQ